MVSDPEERIDLVRDAWTMAISGGILNIILHGIFGCNQAGNFTNTLCKNKGL